MAKDLIFKTDGTFDFGDSKSLSTRFNLAELKMGGRVGFKDRGSLSLSPQYKKLIDIQNKHRFAPEKTRISMAGEGIRGDQVYPQQDLAEDFEILRSEIDNPPKGGSGGSKRKSPIKINEETFTKVDDFVANSKGTLSKKALGEFLGYKIVKKGQSSGQGGLNKVVEAWEDSRDKTFNYKPSKFTADSPKVKQVIDLFENGMSKNAIEFKTGISRKEIRNIFHQFAKQYIGDENLPSGEGKNAVKKRRNKIIKELTDYWKDKPGGKKILEGMNEKLRSIKNMNAKIADMSDEAILNNKMFKEAMNLDVKGLKAGKGINFNRYANLTPDEYIAKIKGLAATNQFYQPEHFISINQKNPSSMLPQNIHTAVGKMGGQMDVLKNYVKNNPTGDTTKEIEKLLINQKIPSSQLKFLKQIGAIAKPILKPIGKLLPGVGVGLGLNDIANASEMGMTSIPEKSLAYVGGVEAAKGYRPVMDYDYKDRAGKEFENIKESWANRGTGSGEVIDDASEQVIGFKTGGSVEPRIPYRDGTSVAPNPPQEKSWEDTTAEWDKTLSAGGFNNDKPMYQKFGDMVDAESLALYYPALLNEAGLNVADFATRLPKVAKYIFEDVLTTPVGTNINSIDTDNSGIHKAWTEITRPYEWSKKVPYGYGEDGIVTLHDLIKNREAKMKADGKSDWPVIAGKNIQLGAELVAPIFPGLKAATSVAKSLKNSGTQFLDGIMSQKGMNTNVIDEALTAKGMGRRDFNKIVATSGLLVALKAAGLSDVFKVTPIKPTTAGIKVLRETSTNMPAWFPQFVDKISAKMIYEGDGISKYVGTADELPGVVVTKNGENWTVGGKNEYGQDFELNYEAPGYIDVGAEGGSPVFYKGDFTANDTVPQGFGRMEDVDYDGALLEEVDDVLGGTRQLEEFATGKEVKTPTRGENRATEAEMKADHDADMYQEQQEPGYWDE